jgi:hypothetical protein
VLHITFPARPYEYGDLRGSIRFHSKKLRPDVVRLDEGSRRYIYAVPDAAELKKILAAHGILDDPVELFQEDRRVLDKLLGLMDAAFRLRVASRPEPSSRNIRHAAHAKQAFQRLLPPASTLTHDDILGARFTDLVRQLADINRQLGDMLNNFSSPHDLRDFHAYSNEEERMSTQKFDQLCHRSFLLKVEMEAYLREKVRPGQGGTNADRIVSRAAAALRK